MPFPNSQRFFYQKNPLAEVVCQLRFPPILLIDKTSPSDFQELIRKEYPLYVEQTEIGENLPREIDSQLPNEITNIISFRPSAHKNYRFTSYDEHWHINLTNNFISITTNAYDKWEHFLEKFSEPLNALIKIYEPSFFTRIGLRYINLINRASLSLDDMAWVELISAHILGILSSSEINPDDILGSLSQEDILLVDKKSKVHIVHGLVKTNKDKEIAYLIDSDFYSEEKMEVKDALGKLKYFNSMARKLFRWCITDTLHQALVPKEL
jgi:uncharacterized protein (TIGR04255 family)